jgi:hypothetical protein
MMFSFLSILLVFDAVNAAYGRGSQKYPILSQICDRSEADRRLSGPRAGEANAQIGRLISTGHVSRARRIAYECLALIRFDEFEHANLSRNCCPPTREEVVGAYTSSATAFFRANDDFLDIIEQAHTREGEDAKILTSTFTAPSRFQDERNSLDVAPNEGFSAMPFGKITSNVGSNMSRGAAVIDRWNDCCSFFRPHSSDYACYNTKQSENAAFCCEISEASDNHLILPALLEPEVNVILRLRDDRSERIDIEQEGSLRMFDVSGVLWPAGYLLGLCLSDPMACGVPEVLDAIVQNELNSHRSLAVELGAGVGFPSIAFSKVLRYHKQKVSNHTEVCDQSHNSPLIVALDVSNSSVSLITTNAHKNGVGRNVIAMRVNQSDITALSRLSQRFTSSDGFDVVIGSSLQAIFDGTSRQDASLWQTLNALLSSKNGNAIVVLAHVKTGDERIELPPNSEFECVRRVSGDHFGMKTRDGHSSDFELVILRRVGGVSRVT